MAEQLLLFPETEEERLLRKIDEIKNSTEKVRKSLFAKHGELTKMYFQLYYEFETLKESICKHS